MFGRSYTPEYPRSKEEFIEMIEGNFGWHGVYEHRNDQPYDLYEGENVKTIHITCFYADNSVWQYIQKTILDYKKAGYSYYEASDDLKNIPIPHIHFVKIIK